MIKSNAVYMIFSIKFNKPFEGLLLAFYLIMNMVPVISVMGQTQDKPMRLAITGISHGHADWIFVRKNKTDIELVGIYEPNVELTQRYVERFKLDENLFFTDLEKMLDNIKPEAAAAFGSIYEHMEVVEACAPRGIHVMLEKPMATNMKHAEKMADLANKNNIHLITNYETSWYPTTEKTYRLIHEENYVGNIRKAVFHHGHKGPKEIGVSKEFLDWLTDPIKNGGGALTDFGCYGANIMTYLMKGQQPVSVTAVTRQYKPELYPNVDDEATIILQYPEAQGIIQASWNWPFNRKDMEVYGEKGYVFAVDNTEMRLRNKENSIEESIKVNAKDVAVYEDPFSYFADVVKSKIKVPQYGLYSLENNLVVVKILDAASESAKHGKTVFLK